MLKTLYEYNEAELGLIAALVKEFHDRQDHAADDFTDAEAAWVAAFRDQAK